MPIGASILSIRKMVTLGTLSILIVCSMWKKHMYQEENYMML